MHIHKKMSNFASIKDITIDTLIKVLLFNLPFLKIYSYNTTVMVKSSFWRTIL